MTVTAFPRRKAPPPKPVPVTRESVTHEERIAAEDLARAALALQRLFGPVWVATAALEKAPGLIEDAEAALAALKELVAP